MNFVSYQGEFQVDDARFKNATDMTAYLRQHGRYSVYNPDMEPFVFKCSPIETCKYRQYEQDQTYAVMICDGANVSILGDCVDPDNKYRIEFHINRWEVDGNGLVTMYPCQMTIALRDNTSVEVEHTKGV